MICVDAYFIFILTQHWAHNIGNTEDWRKQDGSETTLDPFGYHFCSLYNETQCWNSSPIQDGLWWWRTLLETDWSLGLCYNRWPTKPAKWLANWEPFCMACSIFGRPLPDTCEASAPTFSPIQVQPKLPKVPFNNYGNMCTVLYVEGTAAVAPWMMWPQLHNYWMALT